MYFNQIAGWEVLVIMLISFALVSVIFAGIDWGKILRSESKDKWVGISIYLTISLAVSIIISFGIIMIISIDWGGFVV